MICVSRRSVLGCLTLAFLLVIGAILSARLWLPGLGRFLAVPAHEGQADAIVVLSGGLGRTMHGIELYHQGLAPEIWFTGDVPLSEFTSFTDARWSQGIAEVQRVPPGAIRRLRTASTWEDGREVARVAHRAGAKRLLIVTDWYHARRALCTIRYELDDDGVQILFSPSSTLSFNADNWWQHEDGLVAVANEYIKIGFYWWRHAIEPWRCQTEFRDVGYRLGAKRADGTN